MLKKKGWTTSSHSEKSSNEGMKLRSSLPWLKFSTVFASTPNVSVLASIKQNMAAASIKIPPKATAPCPSVKNMNITAPKNKLVLNLKGNAIARLKSPKPKLAPRAASTSLAAPCSFTSSASDLHIAPQKGQIFTEPPYEFGHALQKTLPQVSQ